MQPSLFAAVTAVVEMAPGTFKAEVAPNWTIGGKPNGGYLVVMLARAAVAACPHEHVIAASTHFLRAPDAGQVSIETELLRAGRGASQVRARMVQGEAVCVEALLTVSTLHDVTRPYWVAGLPDPVVAPWEECIRIPGRAPSGLAVPMFDEAEARLDPACLGFAAGRPTGRGELFGWLALPDGEAFDPASLLFAIDAFPPATFDIEISGWVPTLELSAYVRALPAPGPVRILQKAQLIDAQRVDEACYAWDCTGRLVAQATQLAGIRLG